MGENRQVLEFVIQNSFLSRSDWLRCCSTITCASPGRDSQDSENRWEMRSLRISQFDELDDLPPAETVECLRAVTRKVGLGQDTITKLAAFRHGSSGT